MRFFSFVGLIAALLIGGAPAGGVPTVAAADGAWLDVPVAAPWNTAGADLPVAQAPQLPLDERVVARERQPETPEEEALVGRGWRLIAAAQTGWGVRVVQATGGYDGMGRPLQYQAFVFVDGAFAGTLAPLPMDSRTDGALDGFDLDGGDALRATFRRYATPDPLCCPSSRSTVQFRVERLTAGPVVVPVTTEAQ